HSLRLRQLLTGLRMRLEDMLAIRRLQHHPGPARWSMERIGSCNPGAVALFVLNASDSESNFPIFFGMINTVPE
ncbi:hypothetical protein, partial [Aeromonas caviae]|uniref:hypothetical protein n=1 Tax=Aeromonas caviae TaxID=648 RepID=UPI001FC80902